MLKNFWNIWFTIFFLFLAILLTAWLDTIQKLPHDIRFFDFTLIALAVFRLTRLTVYDAITAYVREWFSRSAEHTCCGTIHTLITCPWCIGLWYALLVSFFFFATPYAWFPIFFLAIAGVATFLQLLANLIGWHAEGKKKEVQSHIHT